MFRNGNADLSLSASQVNIEDIFSTYVYTGTGASLDIVNGIDLATDGGMVWSKQRSLAGDHLLTDTTRGTNSQLFTNGTWAQDTQTTAVTSFNSNGYTLGSYAASNGITTSFASWTFKKQPRFFDIVTYTGNGVAGREIAHNLGIAPGMIVVKETSGTGGTTDWAVYHRGMTTPATYYMKLNKTAVEALDASWFGAEATDTVFTVGDATKTNAGAGQTYVAYLFAHDPLGASGDGSDGMIACGSYVGTYPTPIDLDLGWEPQYILIKNATTASNWVVSDSIRGISDNTAAWLAPDSSAAENGVTGGAPLGTLRANGVNIACGLTAVNTASDTFIYMAIRRPMKTPESSDEVFAIDKDRQTSSSSTPNYVSNFPVDMGLIKYYTAAVDWEVGTRLLGATTLHTNLTSAEAVSSDMKFDYMNGFGKAGAASTDFTGWMFKRAKGFFDVVCYTGTGVYEQIFNHSLGAVPELIIVKNRSTSIDWRVSTSKWYATVPWDRASAFNTSNAISGGGSFGSFTDTTFRCTDIISQVNASGNNYVAYLFATLAGISKVGSYTGNGTSQTIDCGFSTGAKFIIIKRTDLAGDWVLADSTRGITTGNVPYLKLNTTDAEDTDEDCFDPSTLGFIVNQTVGANLNVNGATYVYYSISN